MEAVERALRVKRSTPSSDALIAALAATQHGVVSRVQLLAAGVTRDAILHRLRTGRLHPLHRGVYAVGHRAVGERGREMAAVLAGGCDAVLSHQSAAALWGIRPTWRGPVHVTAACHSRRRGIVIHRARSLTPADVTRHHGIPVTTAARTLLDLAGHLSASALERARNEAEILRLTTHEELAALVARTAGRGRVTGHLACDAHGPTRSELEERFLAFLAANDLPRPVVNQRIDGLEVDFHWPHARLIVELDGFAYHSTRAAFEADRARDAALQASGWRVVRITYRRLVEEPGRVAAQLVRLLAPEPGHEAAKPPHLLAPEPGHEAAKPPRLLAPEPGDEAALPQRLLASDPALEVAKPRRLLAPEPGHEGALPRLLLRRAPARAPP